MNSTGGGGGGPASFLDSIIAGPQLKKVERSTAPKPQEEFTGMMGNLAKALDERHKVMHSSDEDDDDDEDEDWDDDEDEDWSD